ncbi:cytochrome P450 3A24-like [Acanthaster planci]|uniref:Cytochrome P450 3A24-like n=1 Tax=Acanthaster planci TaxID=133434 RepID=A0A8B7ZM10_ACAPL|nr:cytochrome P450 3A24-like [Acanthaster planci]
MIGTIIIVLLSTLLVYLSWRTYDQLTFFSKLGLKGPTPVPIFGNLFGFKDGVHIAIGKWIKEYGKTFGISRGAQKVIVTSDVEFVKEVMVKQFSHFVDRQGFPLRPNEMCYDLLDLKGERWRTMRETCSLAFSKHKTERMLSMVNECADTTIKDIQEHGKNTNGVLDIHKYMAEFGIDVGAYCFFASKVTAEQEKFVLMQHAYALWIRFKTVYVPWLLTVLFPKLEPLLKLLGCSIHPQTSVDYFTSLMKAIMDTRKSDPNAQEYVDFLQLMLNSEKGLEIKASNGQSIQKRALTDNEIFSMCMTVFTGNMETSPGTLAYAFFALALHPEVQERVIEEIDRVTADGITPENVRKLAYTDMVLREVLRLYPTVASLNRVCLEDCVVKGIKIPKDTLVEIAVYAIHCDPENWPDPYRFDPERFSAENKAKMDPMTWLAFGQGPRMCLGYRFAMMEMMVIMVRMLKKYRLETCAETEIPPSRGVRGLMSPEHGIKIRLVPRQKQTE